MPPLEEDGEGPSSPTGARTGQATASTDHAMLGEGASSQAGDSSNASPLAILNQAAQGDADDRLTAPTWSSSSSPPRRSSKNEFQNAYGEGSSSDVGDAATSAPGFSSTSTHAQEIGGEGLHATAASSAYSKGKAPLLEDEHEPPSSPPCQYSKIEFQNAFGEGSSSDVFLQDEEGWTVVPIRKKKKKQPLEQGMGNISAAVPPRLMHQSLIHTGRKMLNGKARVDAKVKTRRQPLRRPCQWIKDKDSYYLDELFAEEVRDQELENHQMYLSKASVCKKGFTPCLICFLNDPNEKEKLIERNNTVIMRHCQSAHQCDGIKCEKKGCLARAKTRHDIGIHQDVCFGIKKS